MVNLQKKFCTGRVVLPVLINAILITACQQSIAYSNLSFTNKIALNAELVAYCSVVDTVHLKDCFMKFAKKKQLSNEDAEKAWQLYTSMQHSRSEFCNSGVAVNENIASCSQN